MIMLRSLYCLLALVAMVAPALFGQSASLVGCLLDKETDSPIVGANVTLQGTSRGVSTNEQGRFVLQVDPGTHTLVVSAIGYVMQIRTLSVAENETRIADFILQPSTIDFAEVTTTGELSFSAASSEALRAIDFELRPTSSAQDLLRVVPGLVIAQHAGGGKAEQIYIRGFDADHGTDINLSVDGVPVNMVSHGHGQGYADLHFVIPEVVEGIDVYKGPYFAQFGDLATAGSMRLRTIDVLDKNTASVEGGRFGTYRALGMMSLLNDPTSSSYIAGEAFHSDGYFDNKIDFNRYNLFGKFHSHVSDQASLSVWASAFRSKWNATGQIPVRAVEQGIISRFGSIDPTEGGKTQRFNANASWLNTFSDNSTLMTQAYLSHYTFQLFSNFTFFANDSVNGDGIEQVDSRIIYGARAEYTKEHTLGTVQAIGLLGASIRADDIDVQLFRQTRRQRIGTTADAFIKQKNLSFYGQEELRFSEFVKLQIGLRGDVLFYDVADRIPESTNHMSVSGSVTKAVITPKMNLVVSPASSLDLFLNVGGGFHSNDARAVASDTTERTLPRAWGYEVGVRVKPLERFTVSLAAWGLDLQNELVYVGDEGTTEVNGPTRRLGLDVEARAQLLNWLYADVDMTFSRGRFRELLEGENFIPLAPTLTANAGLTARHESGIEGSLRLRHVSSRPANETNSVIALGYTVFDAAVAYSFLAYRLQFGVENLFNTKWNEAQFDTESRLQNEVAPISELHFTPGTPLNVKMKMEYRF
jgi:outer membrane receptor protein involved in Fe transport